MNKTSKISIFNVGIKNGLKDQPVKKIKSQKALIIQLSKLTIFE